jgi:hypothetical protein
VIIIRQIASYGGQPCREARGFPQRCKAAERLDEDVLNEVVHFAPGNFCQQDSVDHGGIPLVEASESRAVAGAGSGRQVRVRTEWLRHGPMFLAACEKVNAIS